MALIDPKQVLAKAFNIEQKLNPENPDHQGIRALVQGIQKAAEVLDFYRRPTNHGSQQNYAYGVRQGTPSQVEMDGGRLAGQAMYNLYMALQECERKL